MTAPLQGMDADTSRCVADHLVMLTDQLSEAAAELYEDNRGPRAHREGGADRLEARLGARSDWRQGHGRSRRGGRRGC